MNWTSARLYVIALVLLSLLGLVALQAAIKPANTRIVRTPSGLNAIDRGVFLDTKKDGSDRNTIMQNITERAPFVYKAPADDALIEHVSTVGQTQRRNETDSNIQYSISPSYSYLPSGVISPFGTFTKAKNTTATQKALFSYGNALAEVLFSLESTNIRAVAALTAFFDSRTSASGAESISNLSKDYTAIAQKIENIASVPAEVKGIHPNLAESYRAIAISLNNLAKQTSEEGISDAIVVYDAAVESYIKNFVALAALFSSYEVAYSPNDAGNMFTLNASAGL